MLVGLLLLVPASERRKPFFSVPGILNNTTNKFPTRTSARFYKPSPSWCKALAPGWTPSKRHAELPDGSRPQPAVVGRHGAFLLPATIRLGFLRLHRLRTLHVPCYHGYCSPRVSPRSVFSLTALPVQLQDAAPSVGLGGFFQGQWFAEGWPVEAGTFALGSESSALFELYPIAAASVLWGKAWRC